MFIVLPKKKKKKKKTMSAIVGYTYVPFASRDKHYVEKPYGAIDS